MNLLLLSNSTNAGEAYLDYPKFYIREFLGLKHVKALFIPFAAVTMTFDEYEMRVKERFKEIGHDIISIHHFPNSYEAIKNAEAIVVGGGNTFHLLRYLQLSGRMDLLRERIIAGLPYVGWSAGSNIACPTICTTNDMPIVETDGFKAFNLIPFQINPHYTDMIPVGFAGETRDQRIGEYLKANPKATVIGLREGTFLQIKNGKISFTGKYPLKVFRISEAPYELTEKDDIDFLLRN